MGLARQDRGAATRAGVGSPATSLQQRACPQPPCAKGVPGGAGPSAALTLLGDDPYHQSSRRLAADPAAPGMRPRDYRDRLLAALDRGSSPGSRREKATPASRQSIIAFIVRSREFDRRPDESGAPPFLVTAVVIGALCATRFLALAASPGEI